MEYLSHIITALFGAIAGFFLFTALDLFKLSLRHHSRRLRLSEVRRPEIFDLLTSLSSGHKNGLSSVHAQSVEGLFTRAHCETVKLES
jgi:type IV secretory pathway ATPase VirB11/archaellum biosynthesis ATPase